MQLHKNYGIYSVSNDAYAKNANFSKISEGKIDSSKSGNLIRVIDYASVKSRSTLWRVARFAIAFFGSLATLGLANAFSSFRLYWKDAVSGKEHHRVFVNSPKLVKKPAQKTKFDPFEFMEGVKVGAGSDLLVYLQSENPLLEKIQELCSKKESYLTITDRYGYTPLHLSLEQENPAIPSYFLRKTPVAHSKDLINKRTPWLHACAKGSAAEVLDLFIEKLTEKALLETGFGGNALHLAVRRKQTEVIKYLVGKEIGAKLAGQSHEEYDDQDPRKIISRTPLELAQDRAKEDSSYKEIVEILSEGKVILAF